MYTFPGLGLFLDKACRVTLVGSFNPDRDGLFIVADFAFVLHALYVVSTWVCKRIFAYAVVYKWLKSSVKEKEVYIFP